MIESQSNPSPDELLQQFLSRNPEVDLRRIDFHDPRHLSALNWEGLDARELTPHLKSHQRLLRLHPDAGVRQTLLTHGLDSAHRIASIPEHRFVREYAPLFGGDEEQARDVHRRAVAIKGRVKHLWANVKDLAASQHYRTTLFQNADPAMVEYFQSIPSYEELFGGLDYCHCEHCRSIFGPSAYFLDLMRITDQYITEPNTSIPPGYKLEERRPDLFNLELTCANTDTIIPYLQIINRILEHQIAFGYRFKGTGSILIVAGETSVTGSGTLFKQEIKVGDSLECHGEVRTVTAIEDDTHLAVESGWKNDAQCDEYYVVPGSIAFKTLSVSGYPFNLPFNEPLNEIRRYLEELKTSLSTVFLNFLVPQAGLPGVKQIDVAREYLLLSTEEYRVVTTPDPSPESLSRYYGFDVTTHLPFKGDGQISLTAGSKVVNGTGTSFNTQVSTGDQIQCAGQTRTVTSQGSGIISFKLAEVFVDGSETQFSTELSVGDKVLCRDEQRTVAEVISNVRLRVDSPWETNASGADYAIVYQNPASRLIVDTTWDNAATNAEYTVLPWDSLEHVETFTYRTGLDRPQLAELFYQQLDREELAEGIADTFFINQPDESLPYLQIVEDESDPLFPYSKIVGLSLNRLDRLSRFIRLAAKLGWSYADLDWCLKSLGASEITESAISAIATIKRLQVQTNLSVPALCSFWDDIKTIGRVYASNPQDLFDKIYNNPALLDGQNPYVKNEPPVPFTPTQGLPWYVNNEGDETTQPDALSNIIRSRLLAALAVSDNDLTKVGNYLIALNGQVEQPLLMLMPNYAWLYRLTLMPAQLRLSVDEYFVLLCLMYYPEQPYLQPPTGSLPTTPAGVAQIKEAAEWLNLSPFSVYDLQYILTGVVNGGVNPGYAVDGIPSFVKHLSVMSEGSRVVEQSFVFEDIDASESAQKFEALQAAGFISAYGIVLDKEIAYDSLAFLFPVTELTFATQAESGQFIATAQGANQVSITPEESARAFNDLRANDIVIVEGTNNYGTLAESFTATTPLNFLFTSQGSGQARTITAYDGANRIATVEAAWNTVPDTTSLYEIIKAENQGVAQGGDDSGIKLAQDASSSEGAYAGMQVLITDGPGMGERRTIVAYEGLSKVAAVDAPWLVVPTHASQYVVNSVVDSGTAQGGGQTTITLAQTASDVSETYTGMRLIIVPDPKAEVKRGAVRATLLQIQRDIHHTADVLTGLKVLEESNLLGGLADFLSTTPDMLSVLLPFAAHIKDVTVYLEAFLTPIPEEFEDAFTPTLVPSSFVTNDISEDESTEAFAQLVEAQLIIPAADGKSGTVSQSFNKTTNLDFLFVGDEDALVMRQQVRVIMLLSLRAQAVYALIPLLARAVLLVNRLQFTPFETASVLENPEAFDIQDTAQLTLGNIQSLSLFKILEFDFDDTNNLLIQYFSMPPDAECPGAKIDALSSLTGWNAPQICSLINLFWPALSEPYPYNYNTVLGVARLKQCFDLSSLTGVDIYFLLKLCVLGELVNAGEAVAATEQSVTLADTASPLNDAYNGLQIEVALSGEVSETRTIIAYDGSTRTASVDVPFTQSPPDSSASPPVSSAYQVTSLALSDTRWQVIGENWNAYVELARSTLGAIKARYSNQEFNELHKSLTDELNTTARDALLGYTIWLLNQQHREILYPSDLYQYLLIDVEMSGCASTSLISEGIAAVQLYMQRCRMNLEPGITNMCLIPDVWWQWMSSYRVWEANRKIFLYPENYLIPSLRKSQTPLFKELSEELLQTDITDPTVIKAYNTYFDSFDVLANLVYGPGYNCSRVSPTVYSCEGAPVTTVKPVETLFLFGRTSTTPYTYYYRTYENAYTSGSYISWTNWLKVELPINAPYVSPVYAFDRLFIFWTELETNKSSSVRSEGSGNETESQSVVKAVVKYSFLNANQQWAQPQQAAQYIIITAEPYDYDAIEDDAYLKSLFEPQSLDWQQPYVLNIPRGFTGAGFITFQKGSLEVWGKDTRFVAQLQAGDAIWCAGETRIVEEVADNGQLTITKAWETDTAHALYRVIPASQTDTGVESFQGSGTVYVAPSTDIVFGENSSFEAEVAVGDQILITGSPNVYRYVISINSPTSLTINEQVPANANYFQAPYFITHRSEIAEQLMVIYGSDLNPVNTKQADPPPPPDTKNTGKDPFIEAQNEFNESLYHSLLLSRDAVLKMSTKAGYITAGAAIVLEENLLQRETRLIVPSYDYSADLNPRPFASFLDRTINIYKIVQSSNTIYDNYWGNSVPAGGGSETDYTTTGLQLLYNISSRFASLFNVSNQPGWYVFNNGDEAFLVVTKQLNLARLSDMLLPRLYGFSYDGGKKSSLNNVQLAYGAYSDSVVNFNSLKFAFTRLSTHTVEALSRRLLAAGIDGLLTIEAQLTPELPFSRFYGDSNNPSPNMDTAQLPSDRLDFNGSYGAYFWEIFFHAPFLIADQLNANQHFEKAKRWYEYIFNPTQQPEEFLANPNDRFWRFLPLRNLTQESLTEILTDPAQIAVYNNDPFSPDAIARLRPTAYQKAIVMRYIDNLLDWGDLLFAQDTRESITAATNLYVMAADLLGPRPVNVGECPVPEPATFAEIKLAYASQGEEIPEFLIQLENTPYVVSENGVEDVPYSDVPFNDINSYFCVPENEEFLEYWARVADRLYKIRHCMNIQGVERQLALFAPPINPRALVQAAAGGAGTSLGPQIETPLPNYRFTFMVGSAKSLVSQLMQLGYSLLGALQSQDAEQLALLTTTQERAILNLTTQIKQNQVQEALDTQASLVESQNNARYRIDYYQSLITKGLSPGELTNISALQKALMYNVSAGVIRTLSSIGYSIPNTGSPFAMTYGGIQIGAIFEGASGFLELMASVSTYMAESSLTMSNYKRRAEDWTFQQRLAEYDLNSITAQAAANEQRVKSAERELEIHYKTIEQNEALEWFLKNKFTSKELYTWMVSRLSVIYFQTYSLAYDLSRAAQRAYQYELNSEQTFVNFGYWDSLHKGLLAGEGLMLALNQMEKSYIDGNVRTLEIERIVSLQQLNPKALLDLKTKGECVFELTEKFFDYDYPGHYCRKVKTISLTIPAVVGPYQSVKATLTQLSNQIILKPELNAVNYLLGGDVATAPGAQTLRSNWQINQRVAISKGVEDNGMFSLNFSDDRYLPFEGTGAVSTWRLSLPLATNQINFETISDVIVRLKYTALDAGTVFRQAVTKLDAMKPLPWSQFYSLNQNFSQQWFDFMSSHTDTKTQTLSFPLAKLMPLHVKPNARLLGFYLALDLAPGVSGQSSTSYIKFQVTDNTLASIKLGAQNAETQILNPAQSVAKVVGERKIIFDLEATPPALKKDGYLNPLVVRNIVLILYFEGEADWS